MAHYAYINKENNLVVAVTVGKDENELINGLDTETYYAQNTPYYVKRTSYNRTIRKNFAAVGFTYDIERDAFIPPKPFNSWILDEETCQWQAPTPMPTTEGRFYYWSEDDLTWREITND